MNRNRSLPQDSLTDEQFAELLAGRPSADTLSDLQADGDAALELTELKAALQSYRSETLVWAERRAATAPSLASAARRSRMWAAVPQWSLAAVAVATVAVGVAHFSSRPAEDIAQPGLGSASMPVASASAEDIASDNELLTSIDAALSYHGRSPVDELGLKPQRNDAEPQPSNME